MRSWPVTRAWPDATYRAGSDTDAKHHRTGTAGMGNPACATIRSNLKRPGVDYKALADKTPLVETGMAWRRDNTSPGIKRFSGITAKEIEICGYTLCPTDCTRNRSLAIRWYGLMLLAAFAQFIWRRGYASSSHISHAPLEEGRHRRQCCSMVCSASSSAAALVKSCNGKRHVLPRVASSVCCLAMSIWGGQPSTFATLLDVVDSSPPCAARLWLSAASAIHQCRTPAGRVSDASLPWAMILAERRQPAAPSVALVPGAMVDGFC
ncbi:hypothetical protein FQR65_LT20217 [Abscondita terminalis]|nr:hypothetical protein FQR65_LT20217 [Abscondita terminalis]